ncbi:hypothetical protein [Spiroplasma endosymbiont of Othius punctulatus]|uniref:hypothetical protein n=1 Tax=Spiroplasma endosymbiont of Othius punctulatus TaxID=3066289 RepID=UPI0030D3D19D
MYYINADKIKIDNYNIVIELNNLGYMGVCFDKHIETNKFFLFQQSNDYTKINYFSSDEKVTKLIQFLYKIPGVGETIIRQLLTNFDLIELQNVIKNLNINLIIEKTNLKISFVELLIEELNKYFFDIKKTSKDKKVIESLKKLGYKTNQIYNAIRHVEKSNSIDEYIKNLIINISSNEI